MWLLTMGLRGQAHKRAVKRAMLGVSMKNQITREQIRKRTKVTDVALRNDKLK